ncbi:hypothetical protein [Streptomyces sp. ALI-76-A]|uniref:hypothetical protein n=1 Tax=Streptomyces sp. ALI-76-A TaxID=3025736 RepID=UPI00256ED30F|nr:hypothetical protein [Streptomyces sp. ALI-76-A]MDL5205099.1 hypothetical protein [Streptomyces sp. ALI-76-A]
MTTQNPTDGPIHTWFSLSYSNYQVLHRTLMQSMPTAWQERMVACLEELADAYRHIEQPEAFKVEAATEHIVNEMTPVQLDEAGITEDEYDEPVPEDLSPFDLAEWRDEHEKPEPTYSRDGEELDVHERVMLPAADPVPHYNRGRTYIEPRLPKPKEGTWCSFGEGDAPGAGCILPAGHEPANRHVVVPGDVDDE